MDGSYCTCRDKKCPMNPANHDKGCTLCVEKCLRQGEIPSCFFNKLTDDIETVSGFTMADFARQVDRHEHKSGGKRIGMLVAVEIDSVLSRYGQPSFTHNTFGFKVYEYETAGGLLFAIHSGAGELAAAAATQLLISEYDVTAVVNFGVVGGLTPEMKISTPVLVERVVHYDFDTSAFDGYRPGQYAGFEDVYIPLDHHLFTLAMEAAPQLRAVTCASGDKFVDGPEAKGRLHRQFGADICEMELAAIAMTCLRSGVPCLSIKTVSDGVDGGAEDFNRMVRAAGDLCIEITEKIISSL